MRLESSVMWGKSISAEGVMPRLEGEPRNFPGSVFPGRACVRCEERLTTKVTGLKASKKKGPPPLRVQGEGVRRICGTLPH